MKHIINALFEDSRKAREAVSDLKHLGIGETVRYIDDTSRTDVLAGSGIPVERVRMYLDSLANGDVLVSVKTDHSDEQRVLDAVGRHKPSQTEVLHRNS